MSLFDLLFLALVFAALVTLGTAAWLAVSGDFHRALRRLRSLATAAALYMAAVVVTSLILPRRIVPPFQPECFDDWCIGIASASMRGAGTYDVDLRLSSRARRVSQRENNLKVSLESRSGVLYEPESDPEATPFNVLLGPGDAVNARRRFQVPAGEAVAGVRIIHAGGFPIGWFILGYDTWFRKPTLLQLP